MKNGWTGGQYSLVRAGLGLYWTGLVLVRLVESGASFLGIALALLWLAFAVGLFDRTAAFVLAALWLLLVSEFVLDANFGPLLLPFVLVLHVWLPGAPFGSWAARGRADPGGGWTYPAALRTAAWIGFGLALTGTAAMLLAYRGEPVRDFVEHGSGHPEPVPEAWWLEPALAWALIGLAAAFALLAWWPRARPVLVLALLGLFVCALVSIERELFLPTWMLALVFLFDPAWIPPRDPEARERIFYDGACGLCQRWVRFVLAEDASGERFRFAPLQGQTFAREVPAEQRAGLPDSVVVRRADGALLVRSAAALHVLEQLGGLWRVFGMLLRLVPRPMRDLVYDLVARARRRLFAPPPSACPLGPSAVAARFDP